jgi:hypothetical protein
VRVIEHVPEPSYDLSIRQRLISNHALFTRPVAFILAGDMAVAYFIAHAPRGFFPLLNAGELAIIYCFVFLYFAVAGGGVWSFDHLRAGDKGSQSAWRT